MKAIYIKKLRKQIKLLHTLAIACHPIGMTLIGFVFLFTFSYLTILPKSYKFIVLSMVVCFTILIPLAGIFLYSRINRLKNRDLGTRNKRTVIYSLTLFPYISCLYLIYRFNMPGSMIGILVSATFTLIVCTLANLFWKINIHMAGLGFLIGIIIALSPIFYINPIVWLSIIILWAGISGTCSIISKHHTTFQVIAGEVIGIGCGLLANFFI